MAEQSIPRPSARHARHRRLERHRRGDRAPPRPRAGRRRWCSSPAARSACARWPSELGERARQLRRGRPARRGRTRARSAITCSSATAASTCSSTTPAPPGARASPTAATRTCGARWRSTSTPRCASPRRCCRCCAPPRPSAIVNVASTAARVGARGHRRLQRLEVRARRLVGRAVGRGARQRRARRAGPARVHLHRGLPPVRADRQAVDALDRLHPRAGPPRRSTRPASAGEPSATCPRPYALAAALRVLDARARAPRARRRRRRGDDHHDRRRSGRPSQRGRGRHALAEPGATAPGRPRRARTRRPAGPPRRRSWRSGCRSARPAWRRRARSTLASACSTSSTPKYTSQLGGDGGGQARACRRCWRRRS